MDILCGADKLCAAGCGTEGLQTAGQSSAGVSGTAVEDELGGVSNTSGLRTRFAPQLVIAPARIPAPVVASPSAASMMPAAALRLAPATFAVCFE